MVKKMLGPYTYFIIMLIFAGIPLLLLWVFYYKILLKHKKILITTVAGSLVFGGIWDNIATLDDVWMFHNIVNIWIIGLPLEEWFFIILVTLFVTSLSLVLINRGRR